jgi:hypothetical protein
MASGLLTGAFSAERAASLELKEDDLADIAAAIHATGAGPDPCHPRRSLSEGRAAPTATSPSRRIA